jgi:hypothetical protein
MCRRHQNYHAKGRLREHRRRPCLRAVLGVAVAPRNIWSGIEMSGAGRYTIFLRVAGPM